MQKFIMASLLVISSAVSFVGAMEESSCIKIKQSSLMAPQSLGSIEVYRDQDGFHVMQNDELYDVKSYNVDSLLRRADKKTLEKFQKVGYLSVKQMSDGEFSLTANTRLVGGGVLGATIGFWAAKVAVYTVAYGTIFIVTLPMGSFANPATSALMVSLAAPIEAASNVAAIGTAVIGGTITGPV